MGGDLGPPAIIGGVAKAACLHPDTQFLLFGPSRQITAEISRLPPSYSAATTRMVVHDATPFVPPEASAAWALRHGQHTSMALMLRSLDCHHEGATVDAGVSAGNTAALVALARREIGTLPGVSRPAISTSIPTRNGKHCYLLDLGANVDSPAKRLVEFALMGAVMAQCVDGIVRPRVALLNVGVESTKGGRIVREADALIRAMGHSALFDYQGYAEGGDLFQGHLDVLVCDGFVGNAVLKASEGLARMLVERIQASFESRLTGRLLGLLARPALKRFKQELDPVRYNGASLLGLNQTVVKSHGASHADGFCYAVVRAIEEVNQGLPKQLAQRLVQLHKCSD